MTACKSAIILTSSPAQSIIGIDSIYKKGSGMMKKWIKNLTVPALIFMLMMGAALHTSAVMEAPVRDGIEIEKIDFQNPDFIRGMDISSVISLENAGVRFKNEAGQTEDIFKILADNGVNYIRVRIWNDPYDANGNGYGGGNNDLEKATQIGKRAADNGMKLLVDFHYSDFWADPAKQKEPKAWAGMTLAEKQETLYSYTVNSLTELKDAGADIGMVQIGNEITSGIAGAFNNSDRAALLKTGASAVRAFDKSVRVAMHFTNPENTAAMKWFADFLAQNQIDYDVFATSYYPCWHGSLSNLTEVLSYAADKYGKFAMVAETSYPYTLDDTDGHSNTISQWNNNSGDNMLWDFSVQGQADEVRAVMNAVNNVSGGKGLGVFYWEGAWITVGDITGKTGNAWTRQYNANKKLWEQYGCGWASSYSAEYDPDDAGVYYGGSAVDNQAFFDAKGRALASLHVFKNVLTGSVISDALQGDVNLDGAADIRDVTCLQRALAHYEALSPEQCMAADMDGDGSVTVDDATALQRKLAEFPDE